MSTGATFTIHAVAVTLPTLCGQAQRCDAQDGADLARGGPERAAKPPVCNASAE